MNFSDLGKRIQKELPEFSKHDPEKLGKALSIMKQREESQEMTIASPLSYEDVVDEEFERLEYHIGQVRAYYDPDRGRISSWWQRGKSEGRVRLLESLNEELRLLREQQEEIFKIKELKEAHKLAPERTQRALDIERSTHALTLLHHKSIASTFMGAIEKGLSPDDYNAVQRQRADNELAIEQKKILDTLALDNRQGEIDQDLRAAFVFQMQAYEHLRLMTEYINSLYEQVTLAGNERTRNLLEDHITFMEGRFREQQRLLSSGESEIVQGRNEDSESPRDPR